uniref:Protein kinase domain-containing protein n=1 Tax=Panagrolaimus sp. ES5 TaxID=591445 RepID=A0AC34GS40_9BILA
MTGKLGKSERAVSASSKSSDSRRRKKSVSKSLPRDKKSRGKRNKSEEDDQSSRSDKSGSGSDKHHDKSKSDKHDKNSDKQEKQENNNNPEEAQPPPKKEKHKKKKKKNVVEYNAEERKQHRLMTSAERPKLEPGDAVSGMKYKFEVISLLGSGGFGDVYKVKPEEKADDIPEYGAMKTELLNENNNPMMNRLKVECQILKIFETLPPEKKMHFTEMYDRGITPTFKFIVMELVGQSVYAIQKSQPKREFSITTAIKLGLQTLEAVENLHEIGYLHRDIKPHNYSIGLGKRANIIYMLDFGIARQFVQTGTKVLRIPRECVKFLGTLKYASRACHQNKEQSRKDDLEAWFYMQLEFVDHPAVFWSQFKDRKQVIFAKEKLFAGECNPKLFEAVPPEIMKLIGYIDGLIYTSAPDYEYMRALLNQCVKANDLDLSDAFDWEPNAKTKKRWKKKKRFGLFSGDEKAKKKESKKDSSDKDKEPKDGKDKESDREE